MVRVGRLHRAVAAGSVRVMRYDAHETLIAPARPSAHPRKLMGGIVLTVLLFVMFSLLYSAALSRLFSGRDWTGMSAEIENATTPAGVLINLFVFAALIMALAVALRVVHRRDWLTLIGPAGLALRQFRKALLAVLALYAVVALLPQPEVLTPAPNLAPGRWIAFLPLALTGLLVQVAAEELVFRGYLQSQLAARFAAPMIWMGLPSLCFALLHMDMATFGGNAWVVALWAFGFGLAAADLTARAGTLGPAIALHFMNNFSAVLLAAPQGRFDGLALYSYPFALGDDAAFRAFMPVDMMVLLCAWLAVRLALRR